MGLAFSGQVILIITTATSAAVAVLGVRGVWGLGVAATGAVACSPPPSARSGSLDVRFLQLVRSR